VRKADDLVPNVKKIRGLNLPGTPWATSACCGRLSPLRLYVTRITCGDGDDKNDDDDDDDYDDTLM
jgi:hypothetical protein